MVVTMAGDLVFKSNCKFFFFFFFFFFLFFFFFFFVFFFFFTFNILFIHPFFTSVQKNLGGREWQTLHQIYLQVQCIAKTTRSTFLLFYILLNRKITTDFFLQLHNSTRSSVDRKMK